MQSVDTFKITYLGYIALLLPLSGFLLVNVLHVFPMNLFTFIVGVAAIGIVSASTAAYTILPSSAWKVALLLLDGPFWAFIGQYTGRSFPRAIAETALIESTALLFGMLLVVLFSQKAVTIRQRGAACLALGIPLFCVGFVMVRLLQGAEIFTMTALAVGIVQGTVMQYLLTRTDDMLRDATPYILLSVVGWIAAAMGTGIWEGFSGG